VGVSISYQQKTMAKNKITTTTTEEHTIPGGEKSATVIDTVCDMMIHHLNRAKPLIIKAQAPKPLVA